MSESQVVLTFVAGGEGRGHGRDSVVSSVRLHLGNVHDIVQFWNRGGLAGSFTVNAGDGRRIADRLLPPAERDT